MDTHTSTHTPTPSDVHNIQLIVSQCGATTEQATALYADARGDVVQAIAHHLNPRSVSSETPPTALTPTQETLRQLRCIANEKDTMLAQRRAPPSPAASQTPTPTPTSGQA
jgi:hypothetical protein